MDFATADIRDFPTDRSDAADDDRSALRPTAPSPAPGPEPRADHFITRNGVAFAGTHLIIDLWGCENLSDIPAVDAAFRRCVDECGATLLHIHLHPFEPDGVSGVAVLAESHISIHTWPERGYAALDVFMCGDAKPRKAINVLREVFKPTSFAVEEILRGRTDR